MIHAIPNYAPYLKSSTLFNILRHFEGTSQQKRNKLRLQLCHKYKMLIGFSWWIAVYCFRAKMIEVRETTNIFGEKSLLHYRVCQISDPFVFLNKIKMNNFFDISKKEACTSVFGISKELLMNIIGNPRSEAFLSGWDTKIYPFFKTFQYFFK